MRVIALMLLALPACVVQEGPPPVEEPVAESCGDDVPQLDWEAFGEGFVTTYCQGCHASTAVDRHGAPPNIVFDSEEDTLAWRDRILEVAGSQAPTMPPGGGPPDDERDRLAIWLSCFAP